MSNLFARVQEAAKQAAHAEVDRVARLSDFRRFSEATEPTPGWVIPVAPQGIKLYGYQLAAVQTTLGFRRTVVGFAPGMGKTPVALSVVAAAVRDGGRAVAVVPPSLRRNWAQEAARFFPNLRVAVVDGRKPAAFPSNADLVIVGDSVVAHRQEDITAFLTASQRPVLIIDEAQRHKSLGDWAKAAQRATAMVVISDALPADAVVMSLTGTLVVNRASEAYGPIRLAGQTVAKAVSGGQSKTAYWDRWVEYEDLHVGRGRVVRRAIGARDAAGLHERLRQVCYIRVEREAVLDMPAKVWAERDLELNGELKTYRRIESDFLNWVKANRGDEAARRSARAEAVTQLMALWEEAGKAKVKAATEYVQQLLDQDEQVVVMAHHRSVVEALSAALVAAGTTVVQVVGGMSDAAKDEAVQAFRAGRARVLVGNIVAAGTGLNLEQACHLVFVQTTWSPGDLVQASDRIYRVTQRRDCTIHVLNAADSVDERLWGVIGAKAVTADTINSGDANATGLASESTIDMVLASYGF